MNARGSSLIEVLVALALVGLGAVASAALLVSTQRARAEILQHGALAALAGQFAETLREQDARGLALLLSSARHLGPETAPPLPACTAEQPCSSEGASQAALRLWLAELRAAAELPTACLARQDDGDFELTLAWRGASVLPDNEAIACGRDPQPDGSVLYSERGADNRLRRTLRLAFSHLPPG